MHISRIKETCLYVKDLGRTRAFYEGVMEMEVIGMREGEHVFFRAGESVLLCFNPETARQKTHLPPHWGEGALHLAFQVPKDEYENWKSNLKGRGISILQEVEWPHEIRSFYFHDPDGHVLEILEDDIWV